MNLLNEIPSKVEGINVFNGLNDNFYIPQGSFKDMKNMSSDYFPVMGPRTFDRTTLIANETINGVVTLNGNIYIAAGTSLYKNNAKIKNVELTNDTKQMIAYGAYIIIMPDKLIYNTEAEDEEKAVESINLNIEGVQSTGISDSLFSAYNSMLYISDENGNAYVDVQSKIGLALNNVEGTLSSIGVPSVIGQSLPYGYNRESVMNYLEKEDRDYKGKVYYLSWNTDNDTATIEQWFENTSSWMPVGVYCTLQVKTKSAEDAQLIENSISKGDYLNICVKDSAGDVIKESECNPTNWELINKLASGVYVQKVVVLDSDVSIVIKNVDLVNWMKKANYMKESKSGVDASEPDVLMHTPPCVKFPFDNGYTLEIKREIPEMDYMTVCNNRVWGCSSKKHEIYASKLGNAKNWNTYAGLSSDAYAMTVGSEGDFTGAFTFRGYPFFFKENLIICIYGTKPSNYQLNEIFDYGVETGSSKSICFLDGFLYFKSLNGIVRFDGSNISLISEEIGRKIYHSAVAAADDKKYYVSMLDEDNNPTLFVYDKSKGLWHKEDDIYPKMYFNYKNTICAVKDKYITQIRKKASLPIRIGNLFPSNSSEKTPMHTTDGTEINIAQGEWFAETGPLENQSAEHKYIQKIRVRYETFENAELTILVQYDNQENWLTAYRHFGKKMEGPDVAILRPRRCNKFRLRFEGKGISYIHSITYTVNEGSDINASI